MLTINQAGGEEDCLFLSVFAPRNSNKAPKAVMIWWYGGALQGGSVSGFDGSALAANGDVVVLASNYRVGVFGFPGNVSGIPADELNAGFRDQKRALQWIQDNIASFGGDKNRVTVFGDSAGAVSVDSQLLSEPFDKPLFHSAILHSGGLHTFNRIALDIGPYSTGLGVGNKKDEAPFVTLAKALDCPVDQALQCVQSKNVTEVKAGVAKVNLLFPPVDDDALSSVDDSDSARRAKQMVKVPTIVGSTFSEGDIFPENLISSKSIEEWVQIIYPRSESNQKAVLDAYAVGTSPMTQTVSKARRLLHSDYQFACTSTYDADIMASVGIRKFSCPPFRYLPVDLQSAQPPGASCSMPLCPMESWRATAAMSDSSLGRASPPRRTSASAARCRRPGEHSQGTQRLGLAGPSTAAPRRRWPTLEAKAAETRSP